MKSQKSIARLAGAIYLAIFPLYMVSFLFVVPRYIDFMNAAETVVRIESAPTLYILGIFSYLMGQFLFMMIPLLLYKVLSNVSKEAAVLMVLFAFASVPIAFFNEVFRFAPLVLINGGGSIHTFDTPTVNSLSMFFLKLHDHGIMIAQYFWGLWLLPLGYLIIRSTSIPKFLGILLLLGGVSHITEVTLHFAVPNLNEDIVGFMTMPAAVSEILIMLWLLIFGAKKPKPPVVEQAT